VAVLAAGFARGVRGHVPLTGKTLHGQAIEGIDAIQRK